MKVTPVNAPAQTQQTTMTTSAQAARERAISMLTAAPAAAATPQAPTQGNAQAEAVANPNKVSPEEMSAVKAPQTAQITDENTTVEQTEKPKVEVTTPEAELQSKQLQALVRREKALRAQATKQNDDYKAREAALAAREAELTKKASTFDESKYISKDRFKSDPIAVMNETGLSYDEIVNQLITQTQNPVDPRVNAQISQLQAEIKRLQDSREEEKTSQQKAQQQAYDNAVNKVRLDAQALIETDANYETIKETNSVEDVVELIKQTYDKDGILLSVEEAAQEIENYLIEEAIKLANIGKVKQRLNPTNVVAAKTVEQKQPVDPVVEQKQPMKTLTNTVGSTRQLSAKERAILAFKGELK